MADHEATRQRFEDRCWQHYMAERERRDLPGDVVDEFPTREQLFWRQPGGAYGVLMFNAAWLAWCWALDDFGVNNIMMAVVPGDGSGHELYAKSVAEVVEKLTELDEELEGWQLGIRKLPAQQVEHCDPSYTTYKLAEMVMSDCGHSTNNQLLLDRIATRIDRHVESLITPQIVVHPVAQHPNDDDVWGSCNAHFGPLKSAMRPDDHCLRCVTPKKCAIFGCCPGTWPSEGSHGN